jgi:uncharacterized protein (TIGR03492 family)
VYRARPSAGTSRSSRLLLVSNGHGEDAVGGRLVDRLRARASRDVELEAWAMVGAAEAYIDRRVALVGTQNRLPSEGFATLSLALLLRDLRAGWLQVHRRQLRDARAMRGRYDLIVSVGDMVPMLAAIVAQTPFVLVGCAKSAYYGPGHGYTRFEKHLMRRYCARCYPRDAETARELSAARIAVSFVGNPMMDDLQGCVTLALPDDALVVACLPGSRDNAEANAARILSLIADDATAWERSGPVVFIFALAARFDVERAWQAMSPPARAMWRREAPRTGVDASAVAVDARLTRRVSAQFLKGRFADVLHSARVVIGLAGTANEQAIGLGVPLVTFATDGTQGQSYFRMKRRYFGDAAMTIAPNGPALREAVRRLSRDDAQRARMSAAGRARMGEPGASDAIVRDVLAILAARRRDPYA